MNESEPNNRYKTPFAIIEEIKYFSWCQKSRMKGFLFVDFFVHVTTDAPDITLKSHRVRLPQSQCQGKKKYPSWRLAYAGLRGRKDHNMRTGGNEFLDTIRPYKCPHCGFWHIGHRPST
jgi:hypothetical protein